MGGQVLNYFGENIGLYGTSMWAMVRLMSAGRDSTTKPRGAEGSKICTQGHPPKTHFELFAELLTLFLL